MELTEADALGTAEAVRAGRVSAVDVATAHLERSARLGPVVGAFARLTPELALAQAAAIDEAVARGETSAPLLGVPCPIKDLNPVAGIGWEAGSAALRGTLADIDDDIVDWLARSGTVMIGKTATPEFGLPCYTEPDGAPAARTPWDLSRSAGGSSGGAAAAVATGLTPIAHASDGGGSIRIPASACGLVGLKASRGRIGAGRLRTPGPGLGTDGVVSRTVADSAVALDVLAGRGSGETYQVPGPESTFLDAAGRAPGRLRIGVLTQEGCMRALSGAAFNGEAAGRVADHMSREFVIAEPTSDLFHVVSLLSNDGGRRVLIVGEHKLLGVVTPTDALKALDTLRKARESAGDGVNIETVAHGWSALTP